MKRIARRLAFVLLATVLLSVAITGGLCFGQENLAVYLTNINNVLNWDPEEEYGSGYCLQNIYERLLFYQPDGEIVPWLAESYEVSEDGLTWTFMIRKGVKFHTGNDLDAEDVKFSIDYIMDLGLGAAFIWDPVESIEVIDDYTVVFHLKYAVDLAAIAAAGAASYILDSEVATHEWFLEVQECGTGPYKLVRWIESDEVVLTKFDGYWRGWEGKHFDTLLYKFVAETNTRMLMMEKGEGDFAIELPPDAIEWLKKSPNVDIIEVNQWHVLYAFLNTLEPPLDNVLVRKALAYAVPLEAYEEVLGVVHTPGLLPEGLWGHSPDITDYEYDLDKARQLLKEAGYEEGFDLLLTTQTGETIKIKAAEFWQSELGKLGVNVELRYLPWTQQIAMAQAPDPGNRQDVTIMYWYGDYPDPYNSITPIIYHSDPPEYNWSYRSGLGINDMLDEGARLTSSNKALATENLIKIQEIVAQEYSVISLFDVINRYVISKRLQGHLPIPAYADVVFFYNCYPEEQ